MASRSDQLHSHQFALQRAVGALAMRDPDPVSSPMRRIGGALFASVMLAVLAVAAVGVYGVLRPGSGGAWRQGNAIIIEKETGARFVYIDQVLYPVLNSTSAMLILGTSRTVQVPRSELVDVPRGAPMGIPGAPDPLPGPDQLTHDAWVLCSRPKAPSDPPSVGAGASVVSVLRVGSAPAGATELGDGGVLAADPTGHLYLLWHQRRFALVDEKPALAALNWSRDSATVVPASVLNAVPAGEDLRLVVVSGAGTPSPLPGVKVGEVVVVNRLDGTQQYGVAITNGVSQITRIQALMLLADPAGSATLHEVSLSDFTDLTRQPSGPAIDVADRAPEVAPAQVRPPAGGGVCARFLPDTTIPDLLVAQTGEIAPGEVAAPAPAAGVGPSVDFVAVPPGRGVVVTSLAAAGQKQGPFAIVCGLGQRFAVPSTDVLNRLGYGGATVVRLPPAVIDLVPAGPDLDPAKAALPSVTGRS